MINDSQNDIVQSNEIIELLETPEAQLFLNKHINERPENLALTYSGKVNFDLPKLTQILHLYQKAQHKLPDWVINRCAFNSKSYAQSSHWELANFKSSLFGGKNLLDLTSGLGVDATYFAKSFEQVIALEHDLETHQFATYNQQKLQVDNIRFVHTDLESFKYEESYDMIYLDPDRRPEDTRILGDFESYSPNIVEGHSKWLKHTNCLVIKLSPMVDLTVLQRTFQNIHSIYVIGYRNEVKEVLIHLTNDVVETTEHVSIHITKSQVWRYNGESITPQMATSKHESILLEPSKPLIKSGLSHSYCKEMGLSPIKPLGFYYINSQQIENFDGRQFKIIEQIDASIKDVKKLLKKRGIKAIDIAQRHYFDDVRTIRNKLKIKEGGNLFLHFTTDDKGKSLCLLTERI